MNTPELRWKLLKRRFDANYRQKIKAEGKNIPEEPPTNVRNFLKQFVLQHGHPRLDINVSTGTNHLLKSPFCIHPKTGKVAVPLNPKTVEKFDPLEVPTISKLMEEMQKVVIATSEDSKENVNSGTFVNHSSLKPYIELFDVFVNNAVSNS